MLCARISHPHCFRFFNCIYHIPSHNSVLGIAVSTLLDKIEDGLVEGLFCLPTHFVIFLSLLSYLASHLSIFLSSAADSPSREYPLQLMRDFLSPRYHGMAFRGEHGGGLALVFVPFFLALWRI